MAGEDNTIPKIANWRVESLTTQFYAGLDASLIGDESSGNPRVGALFYFRPGLELQQLRTEVLKCNDGTDNCGGWDWYMPHAFGTASYSSAAEQAGADKTANAFDWEIGMFFPMYVGRRGEISATMEEIMFGFIATRGGRQVDGANGFLDRKYPGLRLAYNEELYFDILKGDSEGASKKRWEVRGQVPVSTVGYGRLFAGFNINFGSFSRRDDNENDSVELYVQWQTSFDSLWPGK